MNMLVSSAALATASPFAAAVSPIADPIFAAIERHRAEARAFDEAASAASELEESLPDEIRRSPRVQFGFVDRDKPYYLHSHEHIDERLAWMPDFARTPAIRSRLHEEFDLDVREQQRKQAECGLTAAELRSENLLHSCHDLAWAIAKTVPTSMAGIAAVLRYANEWEDDGDEWPGGAAIGADNWHYQLRQTLVEALGRMT